MKNTIILLFLLLPTLLFAQQPPMTPSPEKQPMPPHPPFAMGPEAEKEALDFLQIIAPFRVEELQALKQVNPPEFQQRVREILDVKHRLDFAKKNDPQRYELMLQETRMEQETQQRGEQYRRARTDEEKNRIGQELQQLLDRLFDVKEKNKELEIKRLEEQLAKLKNTIAERKKNKSQIVAARMEELTDERNSLRW